MKAYKKGMYHVVEERLIKAHNPNSIFRATFFDAEHYFFKKYIRNSRVLVAGSGLGHDSLELAKYNNVVVGVELFPQIVIKAKKISRSNVYYFSGDFFQIAFRKQFDCVVLNMGTISDFANKKELCKKLLQYAQVLYFDFYPPEGIIIRQQMYKQEGWQDVQIKNNVVVSSDGLESESLSKNKVLWLAKSIKADCKIFNLCKFARMAKFTT